jgi:hypothetical protein
MNFSQTPPHHSKSQKSSLGMKNRLQPASAKLQRGKIIKTTSSGEKAKIIEYEANAEKIGY